MTMNINRISLGGLTAKEIEASRKKYGSNAIEAKKRNSFLKQYLSSFGDPIIKILLCVLAINIIFLFRNSNWFETIGIVISVFLATFVSSISEYGSEGAFIKLKEESEKINCKVRRGGKVSVMPVSEIVVGDIILLEAGESISADGILISGRLSVDQSALNGEGAEVSKLAVDGLQSSDGGIKWDIHNKNQIFKGTIITEGEGVMLAERVGEHTYYGDIAKNLLEEKSISPLREKLAALAKTISTLGYIAAIFIAFADLFNAVIFDNNFSMSLIMSELSDFPLMFENIIHALTLSITIIVVAVPEGLPMMITLVLSSNMLRMLRDKVMVRKLVGIETAGSLNILFTDKTGTLTKGKLEATTFISGDNREYSLERRSNGSGTKLKKLYDYLTLSGMYNTSCVISDKKIIGGNATDKALCECIKNNIRDLHMKFERTNFIPFDSKNKYSFAEVRNNSSSNNMPDKIKLVKGAAEKLLTYCKNYYDIDGSIQKINNISMLNSRIKDMGEQAMRVIAVAAVDEKKGNELILIGLIGIHDNIRKEVKASIKMINDAGIQVVMVTGDNKNTAAAIARKSGLVKGSADLILESYELEAMSDEELQKKLPYIRVIARALPNDKIRLVDTAQRSGLVAGMTGDGINDAPALKRADVGFAMGSGTEVAKEAGDIIILDDNISSICKAILYGRTIFKSIRKFIVFQLTMNFAAVGISLIAPFIGIDTPVTVTQMLWINIIMDTLAGLAFAGEPPLREYMREPAKSRKEKVLNKVMMSQILWMGSFTIILSIFFLKSPFIKSLFRYSNDSIYMLTAFFGLFIFCGIFNSINALTHRINPIGRLLHNPSFLLIMGSVAVIQIVLIYYGGALFRTAPLLPRELLSVILLSALVFPADMLRKIILRLFNKTGAL